MKENDTLKFLESTLKNTQATLNGLDKSQQTVNDLMIQAMSKMTKPEDKIKIQQFVNESNKLMEKAKQGISPDISELFNKFGNGNSSNT